jgi:sulfide:quinone oxidoreductase
MTANRLRGRGVSDAGLSVVTHERVPLEIFGARASERVAELLGDAGVTLITETIARSADGSRLEFESGESVAADAVVTLPLLTVPRIPGIPQDRDGFIPTDAHGRVDGLAGVYAAGDATSFPVKQGGIATQQADAAAEAIAASAGAPLEPRPARLVLRGALLTGAAPEFLRADLEDTGSMAARGALWWPSGKIAGRHLGPFLARRAGNETLGASFADLAEYAESDPEATDAAHREALELALTAADAEAGWGDYSTALRWLGVAEALNIVLPEEYVGRRHEWQSGVASQRERRA